MRPDTAEKPETCLDEQRRLDEALGPEIVEIVKVARVVAFELVARAGRVQRLEGVADVLEAVAEDEVVAALEHGGLPLMLELLVALQHREDRKSTRLNSSH